jgi:hypothetical protein
MLTSGNDYPKLLKTYNELIYQIHLQEMKLKKHNPPPVINIFL